MGPKGNLSAPCGEGKHAGCLHHYHGMFRTGKTKEVSSSRGIIKKPEYEEKDFTCGCACHKTKAEVKHA